MTVPKFPARSMTFREKNFPLLQTRAFSSLSFDTINIINMITLDKRYPPKIVGSFKYIVHEYPADIDLYENYHSCCNLEEACNDIVEKFKIIAKQIRMNKDIYLGDFKAGYDKRFEIDIGTIVNSRLKGYNPYNIRNAILYLFEKRLITKEERDEWLIKVIDTPSIKEYIDLEDIIKSKYIIRWTLQDIINGVKELPAKIQISLKDAISQNSVVKIDLWVRLNQRYVEITNWYMLTFKDADGTTVNLSVKPETYKSSLMSDIYYYNNNSLNKAMKLAKRIWLYAVLKNNKELMTALYPLFGSGASKMYQIVGEIDTIKSILKKIKTPNKEYIIQNMEDWKTRLGTVMSDILPIPMAHEIYVKINDMIDSMIDKKITIVVLDDIADKLNFYINKYVKLYFKENSINIDKIINNKNNNNKTLKKSFNKKLNTL